MEIVYVLVPYLWIGFMWIAVGLLPPPLGWLRHDMPLWVCLLYIVIKGAIWPVILIRMLRATINGEEDFKP